MITDKESNTKTRTGQLKSSIPDGLKEVDESGNKIFSIPMKSLDSIEEAEYEET